MDARTHAGKHALAGHVRAPADVLRRAKRAEKIRDPSLIYTDLRLVALFMIIDTRLLILPRYYVIVLLGNLCM